MNTSSSNSTVTEKAESFHAKLHRLRQQVITHWWVLFLTISLGILLQVLLAMRQQDYVYSEGRIMSTAILTNNDNQGIGANQAGGDFFATQQEVLKSAELRRKAAERVKITDPELTPDLQVELDVEQPAHSDIIVLTAKSKNGPYAKAWLQGLMREYFEFRRMTFSKPVDNTVAELRKLQAEAREKVSKQVELIAAWKKRYNDAALTDQNNGAAEYLAKLKQRLAEDQTEFQYLDMLNVEQNANRQNQAPTPSAGPGRPPEGTRVSSITQRYIEAKEQILVRTAEKAQLSQVLKPKHPKIVAYNDEIASLQKRLDIYKGQAEDEIKNQKESLRLQIANTEQDIKEWEVKALELSSRLGEFKQLQSTLDQANLELQSLTDKITSTSSLVSTTPDFMVEMTSASDPKPYKRGLAKDLAIGALGGLVVGIGILLLINQLDDRVRSFSEMQATFDHPIIGHVPRSPITDKPLISEDDDRHMLLESLRNIRSSIFFMPHTGHKPKTLLITSSIPNEGKSTVSSNLAITMAMSGAKTLLIDADMRRGSLHASFETPSTPGLADFLTETAQLKEAIFPTKIKNLSIMSRGRGTNAANDLLLGKQTDTLIKKLYPEYDYIILDSAPVLAADDTSNLAPKVDGVIFVLRASFTPARLARRTLDILLGRQVNILGLVFNCADSGSADYPYYRYEEYHKHTAV
ncbi:MAG TPA: polysaccharide biosynthesis tyrosine autokinase [Chthoniobacterales bacterium]|jgi:capsular exopolysaccharide synthesis family protein